jgi:hypothetical protein
LGDQASALTPVSFGPNSMFASSAAKMDKVTSAQRSPYLYRLTQIENRLRDLCVQLWIPRRLDRKSALPTRYSVEFRRNRGRFFRFFMYDDRCCRWWWTRLVSELCECGWRWSERCLREEGTILVNQARSKASKVNSPILLCYCSQQPQPAQPYSMSPPVLASSNAI